LHERPRPPRAGHRRRLLQRGIHRRERGQGKEECDRSEQQSLDQNHAAQAEKLDWRSGHSEPFPQQVVDEAVVRPEKENPADALHDHRRRQREECTDKDGLPERNIGARHQPGRRCTEQNGEKRRTDRERDGDAPQGPSGYLDDAGVIVQSDRARKAWSRHGHASPDEIDERRQDHRRTDDEQAPNRGGPGIDTEESRETPGRRRDWHGLRLVRHGRTACPGRRGGPEAADTKSSLVRVESCHARDFCRSRRNFLLLEVLTAIDSHSELNSISSMRRRR
jgi:hypothetical protein